MAFETTPFGAIAAPGLAFPFVTHSIETGILQEDKDSEGGGALWAKKGVPGEAGKVYVNQPAGSEAVARVLELEPVMTTASTGTVSVKVDGETVATASVTSESTVATLLTALASAWNSESDYTAEASETKLTITAKTAGAEANADVFSAEYSEDCGFGGDVNQVTAGASAESAGVFIGIAQRTMFNDSYKAGMTVNVLKKGRIWVRVLGEVVSGDAAYVNNTNNAFTATSTDGTAIVGGTFKSDAADGGLAELEIA